MGKGHFGEVKETLNKGSAIQNSVRQNPTSAAICRGRVFNCGYAYKRITLPEFLPTISACRLRGVPRSRACSRCPWNLPFHCRPHLRQRSAWYSIHRHCLAGVCHNNNWRNVCHIVQNIVDVGGINITILVNVAGNYIGRLCHSAVSKMNRSSY